MKCILPLVTFFLLILGSFSYGQLSHVLGQPEGFVTLNGGVKGGEGGPVIHITNAEELKTNLDKVAPTILLIEGTLTISGEISCRGDKTLVGLGTDACIKGGGLAWNTKKNVIVQNILFEGSGDDMLKINNKCENIWIDHCTIRDSETGISKDVDGGLDITRASKNITVSYCHFYNHDKNMLIGHSDSETGDTAITVSIHHCFFDGTIQRNPRVRYATVHLYNNFYVGNSTYGVASACNAKVLVENCYFKNVPSPTIVGVPGFSPAGFLSEKGSVFENCGTPQTKEFSFYFSTLYPYHVTNASEVPLQVSTQAGAGKINSGYQKILASKADNQRIYYHNQKLIFTSGKTGQAELILYDIQGKIVAVPFRRWVRCNEKNSIDLLRYHLGKGVYVSVVKFENELFSNTFSIH